VSLGRRVSREQAAKLLDFAGRPDAKGVASQLFDEQLDGAVAAHNMLQTQGLAYIADEVGTGKTLVAAGALALLRHSDPTMRALIVAPRANLQVKWRRELVSFARHNIRYPDLRVRGLGPEPVRPPRITPRLSALLEMWDEHSNADVVARLSSFELGHRAGTARERVDYIDTWRPLLAAPGTPAIRKLLDAAARGGALDVKEAVAACVNRLLPEIGILVFDEAHNIKAGIVRGAAARNRVLWTLLGHNPDFAGQVPGYGPRVQRVLMLSATPMEDSTEQLLAQLQVLGVDHLAPDLKVEDEQARLAALHSFLFRRLTKTRVGGEALTRNRYRQEWRQGGTLAADQPLPLDDVRARLTFAVVQKKVADTLNGGGGGRHFQIGMLTSFESLAESTDTARRPKQHVDELEDQAVFDDAEQNRAAEPDERRGIDDDGIRTLISSHQEEFDRPPDHPKMDAVVDRLVGGARQGRKALVFTRRVASVDELIQRVNDRIDQDLAVRLREELPGLQSELDALLSGYERHRTGRLSDPSQVELSLTISEADSGQDVADDEQPEGTTTAERDDGETTEEVRGGTSLFAWLFREREADGTLTGWALRQRLEQQSGAYVTLLRDNYVAAALGCQPREVLERLREVLAVDDVAAEVDGRAQLYLGAAATPATLTRFRAAQLAGLHLLEQRTSGDLQRRAAVAFAVLVSSAPSGRRERPSRIVVSDRLSEETLATALRADPELGPALWHPTLMWAWADEDAFLRREWRWRLLGAAVRLDFAALDLWLCEVRRNGGLRRGGDPDSETLVRDFLAVLRKQRDEPNERWTSYAALTALAADADLVLEVNGVQQENEAVPAWVGNRVPAVGMSGQINATAVRQFRTPTYPLVLVSTDLLQQGEDLHTFCDEVHHYGIAWMPSALEQRTGRIDRVNSLAERRLSAVGAALGEDGRPWPEDRLQVLYPFVSGTYEQLQVRRVLKRLDEHIRLLHESFGNQVKAPQRLLVDEEIVDEAPMPEPMANLGEPYKIDDGWLRARAKRFPVVDGSAAEDGLTRFAALTSQKRWGAHEVDWLSRSSGRHLLGEVRIGDRVQPLDLRLTTAHGHPAVRLISPVGLCDLKDVEALLEGESPVDGPRMGVVRLGPRERRSFSVTVEDLLLFPAAGDLAAQLRPRIVALIVQADELEQRLLEGDRGIRVFATDLVGEARDGRLA